VDQRIQLVDEHGSELGVNRCLAALGVPRSTYFARKRAVSQVERDAAVYDSLRRIIGEHPAYGWRRLQAELFEVDGLVVNHKRLKRILRNHELGLPRHVARNRKPGPAGLLDLQEDSIDLVRGREFGPLEAFSTDFTELVYSGGRKAWLMVLVDIQSKFAAGWTVGPSRNRDLALRSLDALVAALREFGLQPYERIVHHDKDSVYTSYAWLAELLLKHGMRVSYSENGARHNPWVESLWSRTKDECKSRIIEAPDLVELEAVIAEHFAYYNSRRRHSSLGNRPPLGYLQERGHHRLSQN